jgi:flagellar motor switch protein FliM
MSNEFLSQDEVDALLKGVSGEEDAPAAADDAAGGVRPYNLATQERIVRGRMPTLEIINDRFMRNLRVGLFNFMRRSPEITIEPVRVIKYSEFLRNLAVPTNLNILQAKPLRGSALLVIEPTLVFVIVDTLFGGDGRFHTRIEGREFTATEQRIIQRMLEVMLADYAKAWSGVYPLQFDYLRSEMQTQFVNIATPTEIVVVSSFKLELGSGGGDFHICMPYSLLEPIRDLIYSPMPGDQTEPDRRWVRMLQRQVQSAEVELVAGLATSSLRLKDLVNLKPGDILPIDIPETIEAAVGGVPVMECRYGVRNGQYALRIERMLVPDADATAGGSHA